MKPESAFVVSLLLLVAATVIARKYLPKGGQVTLGLIAAAGHLL